MNSMQDQGIVQYDTVSKFPKYRVFVPYRATIVWPRCCMLCRSPDIVKSKSYQVQFTSDYKIVTTDTTKLTLPGAGLCADCAKKVDRTTTVQLAMILVGVLVGLLVAGTGIGITGLVDSSYVCNAICPAIIIGVFFFFIFSSCNLMYAGSRIRISSKFPELIILSASSVRITGIVVLFSIIENGKSRF